MVIDPNLLANLLVGSCPAIIHTAQAPRQIYGAQLKTPCAEQVPQLADRLQPIVNCLPLQLLSYHLAVLRSFTVNQPRNLANM